MLALESNADMAIIPMQDILGLDAAHRMNTPGTIVDNWQWRFNWDMLKQSAQEYIKNAIAQTQRTQKWQ